MVEMREIVCDGFVLKVCIDVIELDNVSIESTIVMVNSTVLMVRMNWIVLSSGVVGLLKRNAIQLMSISVSQLTTLLIRHRVDHAFRTRRQVMDKSIALVLVTNVTLYHVQTIECLEIDSCVTIKQYVLIMQRFAMVLMIVLIELMNQSVSGIETSVKLVNMHAPMNTDAEVRDAIPTTIVWGEGIGFGVQARPKLVARIALTSIEKYARGTHPATIVNFRSLNPLHMKRR
jgi:hypothetical protein